MSSQFNQPESNPWKWAALVLVGIIVGYAFSQFSSPDTPLTDAPSDSDEEVVVDEGDIEGEEDIILPLDVSIDDDAILGDEDALLTIVEFSDFQCPYCQKFHNDTFALLKENYIDTGKANFVYRDFPLSSHPKAIPAAEAAECAGEQDAYFAMHNMIFDNYVEWTSVEDPTDTLKSYAVELGLDSVAFDSCVDNHDMLTEIQNDLNDAYDYEVNSTPTFFLNGYRLVGAQPYSVFSNAIDSLLTE